MSQLKVDSIIPTTGAPTSGGGGIVQVVQNSDTTTTGILDLGSGNAFASIPNLNVTITPKSASSKILLSFQAWGEGDEQDHKYQLRVQRAISGGATTNITAPAAGSRISTMTMVAVGYNGSDQNSTPAIGAVSNYLDSPSTTSAITYTVQIRSHESGSSEWNYNRTNADSDGADFERGISWITVMEVSA